MRYFLLFLFLFSRLEGTFLDYLENYPQTRANIGIAVQELETGTWEIQFHAGQAFIPASLTKLFTTYSLLKHFPEDTILKTQIRSSHPIDSDGVLKGNLFLYGEGDPFVTADDIKAFAFDLQKMGLKVVLGEILIERESLIPLHPHGEVEDLLEDYFAPVTPLSIQENVFSLRITEGEVSMDLDIPYLEICNEVNVADGTSQISLQLEERKLTIKGTIPPNQQKIYRIPIPSPDQYVKELLTYYLEKQGIQILNQKISSPAQYQQVDHSSLPFADLIYITNKKSHDLLANQFLCYLGDSTDYRKGVQIRKKDFEGIVDDLTLFCGNGISRHNHVSPNEVVNLLKNVKNEAFFPTFFRSLPIGGVDGTIADFFKNTPLEGNIFAKTGSFSDTENLAGYFQTPDGKTHAFCVMVNFSSLPFPEKKIWIEGLLLEIYSELIQE